MAELVAAVGVPHTPLFPLMVKQQGPGSATGQIFSEVQGLIDEAGADVIVMFDSDHLNTYFLDSWPGLAVPVAEHAKGTNDGTPGMRERSVALEPELGLHLLTQLTDDGFFPARSAALTLDHSVMVPLHFLDPDERMTLQPVYLNGLVPPLPSGSTCLDVGARVRTVIESWRSPARVALVASGSFSLEVGGPRVDDGSLSGVPDPEWALHVTNRLKAGQTTELIHEATTPRMQRAGNVAGELLNWLALLGAVGDRPVQFIEHQAEYGHSFAAWDVS